MQLKSKKTAWVKIKRLQKTWLFSKQTIQTFEVFYGVIGHIEQNCRNSNFSLQAEFGVYLPLVCVAPRCPHWCCSDVLKWESPEDSAQLSGNLSHTHIYTQSLLSLKKKSNNFWGQLLINCKTKNFSKTVSEMHISIKICSPINHDYSLEAKDFRRVLGFKITCFGSIIYHFG